MAEVLEEIERLGIEHLGNADAAAEAPAVVAGDPSEGGVGVGLGGDDVGDGAVGEGLVVVVEDEFGGGGGGGDDGGGGAEMEGEEGAVEGGEGGEGDVRVAAEVVEGADYGEAGGTWWEVWWWRAAAMEWFDDGGGDEPDECDDAEESGEFHCTLSPGDRKSVV